MFAIHLRGPNDRNGNPVRCYLILDNDGDAVDAVDEGYAGHGALKRDYHDGRRGPGLARHVRRARECLQVAPHLQKPLPVARARFTGHP